jgi:hypothetical protein
MPNLDWKLILEVAIPVLLVLAGIALAIARGKAKEFAFAVWVFLVKYAQMTVDQITEEQVKATAKALYDSLPGWVGPIPWKMIYPVGKFQELAWTAFQEARQRLDGIPVGKLINAIKELPELTEARKRELARSIIASKG